MRVLLKFLHAGSLRIPALNFVAALVAVFLLASGATAAAQTSLIAPNSPSGLAFNGTGYGSASIQSMTGPAFTQGWELKISTRPPTHTAVMLSATTQAAVAQGDLIIATFYYRRKDTINTEADLFVGVQQTASPNTPSLSLPLRGRTMWRQASIPFEAVASSAAGGLSLLFEMGSQTQTIDIAGVTLTDYGQCSVFSPGNIDATPYFGFAGSVGTTNYGTLTTVSITNLPPYTKATQIQTTTVPPDDYNVRFGASIPANINQGDTLVAMFWMRTISLPAGSGELLGVGGAAAQYAGPPYTGSYGNGTMMVDTNWKQWIVPFSAVIAYPSGKLVFYIKTGAQKQTVQLAGLQLVDLGTAVSVASLTGNQNDYPGRELGNSWRTAANARIAALRTGKFTINVTNASGTAVAGVKVTAAMKQHLFGWGCQTSPNYIAQNFNTTYQQNFLALCNSAEVGAYKWGEWEAPNFQPELYTTLTFLRSAGISNLRAHNLIWPSFSLCPSDVGTLSGAAPWQTSPLENRVIGHIDNEVGSPQVRSFFTDWDAINEPWDHDDIENTFAGQSLYPAATGPSTPVAAQAQAASDAGYIAAWLAETRAQDPHAHLFINDWGLVEGNTSQVINDPHADYDYDLFSNLLNSGAQLDGVGFESHFGIACMPPAILKTVFDKYAALGLRENVTEFDQAITDTQLQADWMTDYMTMVFSEPNFDFFDVWTIWDGPVQNNPANTYTEGPMYDNYWNPKLTYETWQALVFGTWWTNTSGTSSSSGVATMSGYLGRYALTATSGGITKTYYADLPSNAGATVNLELTGLKGKSNVWLSEAEKPANAIYSPLVVSNDPNASGGQYVSAPVPGTDNTNAPPAPEMRVDTEAVGTVNVWLRVIAPDASGDFFWMAADNGSWQSFALPNAPAWTWVKYSTTVTFTAGQHHSLFFAHGTCGTQLDQVLITDDLSYVPR